ncbi:CBS domain-containing protein [Pseudomonas zhanjiangensis]|uniref:CBS domain-containing protein n=1 Tax=Pseudomonas zhanjiangensis TaxID=3239015 RepID=A0ABV3YQ40_9PSED
MAIGEYCCREIVAITPSESVLVAARLMREHHVGDLVLVEPTDNQGFLPVGIITDRDIVLDLIANTEGDLSRIAVGDLQRRELLTVHEQEDVFAVIAKMRQAGVRRLPVVDDRGLLAGIIAADDLVGVLAEGLQDLARLTTYQGQQESSLRPE